MTAPVLVDDLAANCSTDRELTELLEITGATAFWTGNGWLVPEVRGARTYVPLLCEIGTTPVTRAVRHATTLIGELGLYPGDMDDLTATFTAIERWSTDHAEPLLADLVGALAEQLICDLAEIPDLRFALPVPVSARGPVRDQLAEAQASAAAARRRAHHVRNALVALRAATVLTRPRLRHMRLALDTLAAGLPALPGLVGRKKRPLTDEEVLLARLLVELDLSELGRQDDPRPTIAYLVGEAGIRCGESTVTTTASLDDLDRPTTLKSQGSWDFGKRSVSLTPYVSRALPPLLARLRPGTQRLTYDGNKPGTRAAGNSLHPMIVRHLRRAGVTDPEVTPMSVNLWAAHRALTHDGDIRNALHYHGGATVNLLEDLKLKADDAELVRGVIHLYDRTTSEYVVSVPTRDSFSDGSMTKKGRRRHTRTVRRSQPA